MSQLGLGKTGPTVTWREPTTSYYSPPSSISAGDVVDFVAGFVPGYDLAKAIMNPNATGMDYAVGVLGVVPGFGKGASLGLKGASTVMRVENAAVHGLSAVDNLAARGIGSTGKVGENALKALGGDSQVYFKTSQGGRYVDQLVNGVAHESKVGYTSLTSTIRGQIAKDAELIQSGRIDGATWNFFTSPVTGKGGASQPLLDALRQNGIDYIVH